MGICQAASPAFDIPDNLSYLVENKLHRHDSNILLSFESKVMVLSNSEALDSPVLLQSGLDEKWWADSMECYDLRNVPRLPGRREIFLWETIWRTIQRDDSSVWSNRRTLCDFSKRSSKASSVWLYSSTRYLLGLCIDHWENLEVAFLVADIDELEDSDASEVYHRGLCMRRKS